MAPPPENVSVTAPAGARRVAGTSLAGVFSVAPDGQTLAFGATGADGVSRLFVRRLDEARAARHLTLRW